MPRYTTQDWSKFQAALGCVPVSTIAERMGRSLGALRKKYPHHRRNAVATVGMSPAEVAEALGLAVSSVYKFTADGRLPTRRRVVDRQRVLAIDPDDLLAFLRDGYVLMPSIRPPSLEWREIVDELRAEAHARFVTRREIEGTLHLCEGGMWSYFNHRLQFPVPQINLPGAGGGYLYLRAEVAAWLRRNPCYISADAVEAFGLSTWREEAT